MLHHIRQAFHVVNESFVLKITFLLLVAIALPAYLISELTAQLSVGAR